MKARSHHAVLGPVSPGKGLELLRWQRSEGFKATANF